jgi:peroxiredoxin-like protein
LESQKAVRDNTAWVSSKRENDDVRERQNFENHRGQYMEETHKFRVVAWWSTGRTGIAKSDSAPNAIQFTAPAAFGGIEGRWTPEDLLLGSVASCYTTTFQAIAAYSKFDYKDLEVEVEGLVSKSNTGYGFQTIVIRPKLTIADEAGRQDAVNVLRQAETLCLVSRAFAAAPKFDPKVEVAEVTRCSAVFTSGKTNLTGDGKSVVQGVVVQ